MTMRRLILATALCALTAAVAEPQSSDRAAQPARGGTARERPVVNVQRVPDAPLSLTVETKWATPDQQMLEVYVSVQNVGRKSIRAYAVRVGDGIGAQEGRGCYLDNAAKSGKILLPG